MHRFYVPGLDLASAEIALPRETAHQVSRVLRLKPGEEIGLFDGSGREWPATISSIEKSAVSATVGEPFEPDVEATVAVSMLMAPIRHERFELALQKATELGAASIVPVVTERVLGHEAKISDSRFQRWERIVIEAAEQSGRVRVPALEQSVSLEQGVNVAADSGPVLLLWEEEHSVGLAEEIRRLRSEGDVRQLALVVGPIGGLTSEEVEMAKQAGATPVAMGRRILRAETAVMAALAIAMSELGELGA